MSKNIGPYLDFPPSFNYHANKANQGFCGSSSLQVKIGPSCGTEDDVGTIPWYYSLLVRCPWYYLHLITVLLCMDRSSIIDNSNSDLQKACLRYYLCISKLVGNVCITPISPCMGKSGRFSVEIFLYSEDFST